MSEADETRDDIKVENQGSELSEQLIIRRQKFADLQERGKDPFHIVKYDVTHHGKDILDNFESMESSEVSVAGRMMTKRIMGKASFCDLSDLSGKIQIYIRKDEIGEESYQEFVHFDIGDILGIKGTVFRTQKGEISVKASEVTLLSKSLRVLPEKWHGLKDQELRYRHRYVDMIVNPDVREVFIARSKIIRSIRNFMDGRGYLEVETPVLETFAGGATARPFKTHHNALDIDMYLRIALELPLKMCIVGGMERVYEIGRVFRNEGVSIKHNPEFTMLEFYEAYTDYYGMMEMIESLIKTAIKEVLGEENMIIKYGDLEIDFQKPFEKMTMIEAIKRYGEVDFDEIKTDDEARAMADKHGIEYEDRHVRGDIIALFFEEYAEKHLIHPTFILDHPIEISPLTKKKPGHPELTERFELFIVGREFANAYSELNDPIDQRERFLYQEKMREAGDDEANMIDEDFIEAMEYGMPPTGGLGFGIDRFVMLLTNSYSIRDVLLFPTMKPLK